MVFWNEHRIVNYSKDFFDVDHFFLMPAIYYGQCYQGNLSHIFHMTLIFPTQGEGLSNSMGSH